MRLFVELGVLVLGDVFWCLRPKRLRRVEGLNREYTRKADMFRTGFDHLADAGGVSEFLAVRGPDPGLVLTGLAGQHVNL